MRHERIVDSVVEAKQVVQMLVLRRLLLMAAHCRRNVLDLQHVIGSRNVWEQRGDNQRYADETQQTRTERAKALIPIIDPRHQHQSGQSKAGPN